MKQINIKKRLYLLPIVLFCISLQGTEIEQTNEKAASDYDNYANQALDDLDSDLMRKHNHHKPKPNNSGSHNTNWSLSNINSVESSNMAESPGTLDRSFGKGGYVINPMGLNSVPKAVVTQSDNKIVVAGKRDFYPFLARYNENGELDKSFGINDYGPGVVIQTSEKGSWFNAVAIQEQCCNRKIIAVGSKVKFSSIETEGIIARYHEGGTLDTTFGDKGLVRTGIKGELNDVLVQPDGKIIVAGYEEKMIRYTTTYSCGNSRGTCNGADWISNHLLLLMRYNENGTLDNTFGSNGVVTLPLNVINLNVNDQINYQPGYKSLAQANKIVIEHGDRITLVGTTTTNMFVAAFLNNGQPDNKFNRSNFLTISNYTPYDAVLKNPNELAIVGSSNANDKVFTSMINFQPFSTSPTGNSNDNAYARSVVVDETRKIIVIGSTITADNKNNYFSMIRYNSINTLDKTFGQQGIQNTLLTLDNKPNKITLPAIGTIQQDKKKLIVVGMYSDKVSPTGSLMTVSRYWN